MEQMSTGEFAPARRGQRRGCRLQAMWTYTQDPGWDRLGGGVHTHERDR